MPVHVKYDNLDMDVIGAIGDSAASLGLISTLVFSIAVTIVLEVKITGKEGMMMCMCVAISTSTYTTTYSLLEYYYSMTVKGLNQYVINEVPQEPEESNPDTATEEQGALTAAGSDGDEQLRKRLTAGRAWTHGDLMKVCIDGFASFNGMRQYARNATWGAICSILVAGISKNEEVEVEVCWKSVLFFGILFCLMVSVYAAGFNSADVKMYAAISLVGLAVTSSVALFYDPDFDMPRYLCSSILLCGVAAVTYTVKAFRAVFMPLIQEHAKVY